MKSYLKKEDGLSQEDLEAINNVLLEMKESEPKQEDFEPLKEEPKSVTRTTKEEWDKQVKQQSKESMLSKLYNDEETTKGEFEEHMMTQEDLDECLVNLSAPSTTTNQDDSLNLMEEVVEDRIKELEAQLEEHKEMYNSISYFRSQQEEPKSQTQDAILEGYTSVVPIRDEAKEALLHQNEIKAQEWQEYLKNQA